jgi:hypothetical protein
MRAGDHDRNWEARFHELLKLLTASNPEIDAVQSAVDALDRQSPAARPEEPAYVCATTP